ncbi:MAG TPA: type II toxin-antitoxin system PemK/MazF family toxin [Planctomycetaceae bacterium]|nr:type II toxin-antitoxin system PemK/MazF family toxin [Planctomycetaceae bacterium]
MPSVSRGDVVLLPIAFVSGQGTKVRPALVVQNDNLNQRLNSTVVVIITSTTVRAHVEPSQLFIDVTTSDGQRTGLLHNSTAKCEHLDTVDQGDIRRVIGRFSPQLMEQLEQCIHAALDMP